MGEIVNGNPLDKNQSGKTRVKTTKFKWVYDLFGTYRFGEYGFAFLFNGIAKDKVKVRQGSTVESYSMGAPLMTSITMNKSYFQVPRQAILPFNWEKIYTNPSIGQDIDATIAGTSVSAAVMNYFLSSLNNKIKNHKIFEVFTSINETEIEFTLSVIKNTIKVALERITALELMFSNGSLINAQGAHFNRLVNIKGGTFDEYIETCLSILFKHISYIWVTNTRTNKTYIVKVNKPNNTDVSGLGTYPIITLHQLLEEYRDGETFSIGNIMDLEPAYYTDPEDEEEMFHTKFEQLINDIGELANKYGTITIKSYTKPFDIAYLWAYQLACAEFFTNDKVDYIYNAELFRQYIGNLYDNYMYATEGEHVKNTIELNGIRYELDYLSASNFGIMTSSYNDYTIEDGVITETDQGYTYMRAYIFAMLKYNRSLKYKDYFTGARTRPIAIGNTQIDVNDSVVEVIDVVKNIQKQRFLNVVNKIPRDLKGYTKGIFGKDVAPDWHNPLFLIRTSNTIYGQETENTGEAQLTEGQTRTTVLKNAGGNVQFNFDLDRNSIIVGMIGFDIPRAYSKGVKRMYMDVDRYDMFNPYLQYCGDQEVYGEELDARKDTKFGYQGSYMHMKQEYSEAFGGFIEDLKGWTFLDRYVEGENLNQVDYDSNVSPDWIRSKPSELDRFYISLTGNTLAKYFHFIIKHTTSVEAIRPMAYNPQILG